MTRPIAIAKADALNLVTPEVEAILEKVMPLINKKLKNFTPGSYRTIDLEDIGLGNISAELSPKVVEEILKEYRSQKWTVKHENTGQPDNQEYFFFS